MTHLIAISFCCHILISWEYSTSIKIIPLLSQKMVTKWFLFDMFFWTTVSGISPEPLSMTCFWIFLHCSQYTLVSSTVINCRRKLFSWYCWRSREQHLTRFALWNSFNWCGTLTFCRYCLPLLHRCLHTDWWLDPIWSAIIRVVNLLSKWSTSSIYSPISENGLPLRILSLKSSSESSLNLLYQFWMFSNWLFAPKVLFISLWEAVDVNFGLNQENIMISIIFYQNSF